MIICGTIFVNWSEQTGTSAFNTVVVASSQAGTIPTSAGNEIALASIPARSKFVAVSDEELSLLAARREAGSEPSVRPGVPGQI